MILDEIYFWDTYKAKGHFRRDKYHVFICEADWQEENTFLFISKANYNGDYLISNSAYTFLPLATSYIGGCVFYSDQELAVAQPKLMGKLTDSDLKGLFQSVAASQTIEGAHILRVCNALKEAF